MIRVHPYGDRGLLLELADTAEVVACVDALRTAAASTDVVADVVADIVPGACTVLLVARDGVGLDRLRDAVPDAEALTAARARGAEHADAPTEVRIPVHYGGPDLAEVAAATGLSEDAVVHAHTATPWRVAFGGFAPGFAYLVGGDPRLAVPRRPTPRPSVPPGSVGLAGGFSGVYPRSSPGGWQLIGRTDAVLWDTDREPPALLGAGAVVRFEAR
ncbi:5-oxoprolinase subunit B family protein [Nocardioides faecalis]|uniref:5-oxoprolinase subunit B family protein n=1 Tax=Nocardioides faecalis TaxID=2803858 RepID=UPI0020C0FA75|nr:allophanate hydrolase subunit 1 [Nocardioides faecalis]